MKRLQIKSLLLKSLVAVCSACGFEESTAPLVLAPKDCEGALVLATPAKTARQAKSVGFGGTPEAYAALYDVGCVADADCAEACLASGGSAEMCGASECVPQSAMLSACLPAPVWSNLEGAFAESSDVEDTAQLVVVDTPYRDRLLTSKFDLEVPQDAVIRGIQVSVRHAGDDSISDESVKLTKNEQPVGAERALAQSWSSDQLKWTDYGGPDDPWGEAWAPEQLNAEGFGVVQSVRYAKTAGNSRAYVDQVRVVVHYSRSQDCQ